MTGNRHMPLSLKVVAILFILGGIGAVLEIVVSLLRNRINVNFGVLGLFIGPGLLALRPGWRACALVFLWIAMIGVPIAALLMVTQSGPVNVTVLGQEIGHTSKVLALIIAAAVFALAVWQYRVLMRPDVRRLFRSQGANE